VPTSALPLIAGETIQFRVNLRQNYFSDSTALSATTTSIPEPATLALVAVPALLALVRPRQNND
jgi:hypothetical protein